MKEKQELDTDKANCNLRSLIKTSAALIGVGLLGSVTNALAEPQNAIVSCNFNVC